MLKNRPEPNKTGSVGTGSRFGPGNINKEYYFPVRLNFWVKTGPDRTVNTPTCQLGPVPPCSQMMQKHVLKYVIVNHILTHLPLITKWLITSHKLKKNMMSTILSQPTLNVLSSLNEN